MELFETLQNLFEKNEDVSSFTEHSNYFMVIKWLSMLPSTLVATIRVNELAGGLPNWAVGCLLDNLIKKRNAQPRITYIHDNHEKDSKKFDKEVVGLLVNYFGCNEKHAAQAQLILESQGINIRQVFGLKEKKLK